MGLVADHQIEMPAGKQFPLFIFHGIDTAHHGLVSGKNAVGLIVIFLIAEIGHGQMGKQIDKASLGLCHQGIAVSQKQDILYPSVFQQHITEGDNGSGLP